MLLAELLSVKEHEPRKDTAWHHKHNSQPDICGIPHLAMYNSPGGYNTIVCRTQLWNEFNTCSYLGYVQVTLLVIRGLVSPSQVMLGN